jgi:Holliday junction resolvasome RuvABC ATP-dependent DNA helicase subunit
MPYPCGTARVTGRDEAIGCLREFSSNCRSKGKFPGHILLTGDDDQGKRALAHAYVEEYDRGIREVAADMLGESELMGHLTKLSDGDVLFVEHVGELRGAEKKQFCQALEEFRVDFAIETGMFEKTVRVPLKTFTCIATARSEEECSPSLLNAFHFHLSFSKRLQAELERKGRAVAQPESLKGENQRAVQSSPSTWGRLEASQARSAWESEIRAIGVGLKELVDALSTPIQSMVGSCTAFNSKGESVDLGKLRLEDYVLSDCVELVATIAQVDGYLSDNKVRAFVEVTWPVRLGESLPANTAEEAVNEFMKPLADVQNQQDVITGKLSYPISVQLIENYDKLCNTQYAAKAHGLWTRLTTLVANADGKPSAKAQQLLHDFESRFQERVWHQFQPLGSASDVKPKPSGESGTVGPPLEQLLAKLDGLIGLDRVKRDVLELVNYIKVQQLRRAQGLKTSELSQHLVFYGKPGTGKTTVARILAEIYKSLGVVSKGHLVETDRAGLVAGYMGQTALKVTEVIKQAIGGILFIDEAYALTPPDDSGRDYGREAIETLVKQMEDHRDDLVVVVAGYTEEMKRFLNGNPGLQSRFTRYTVFDDYTPSQLVQIFRLFCKEKDYYLTSRAEEKLLGLFSAAFETRERTFGNARLARNLFEEAIKNLANRIVKLPSADKDVLMTIQENDIPDQPTPASP